jgi:hypothetical protein
LVGMVSCRQELHGMTIMEETLQLAHLSGHIHPGRHTGGVVVCCTRVGATQGYVQPGRCELRCSDDADVAHAVHRPLVEPVHQHVALAVCRGHQPAVGGVLLGVTICGSD